MAEPGEEKDHGEILIRRHHAVDHEAHHGGAWKIAFADFMTAMMALFLVLWLISSTSEKTRHTVAQYFNPVKLVDMSTLKKGFRDPKETEMGSGPNPKETPNESDSSKRTPPPGKTEESSPEKSIKAQDAREAALFRDPYAVLAEIAAATPGQSSKTAAAQTNLQQDDSAQRLTDPFTTMPDDAQKTMDDAPSLAPGRQAADAAQEKLYDRENLAPAIPDSQSRTASSKAQAPQIPGGEQTSAPAPKEADNQKETRSMEEQAAKGREAAKLRASVAQALSEYALGQQSPRVEVRDTGEGVLISLTDEAGFSMFAVGSAEPRPETVRIMERIGEILKASPGSIVIRGHTDGRPFKGGPYDNWRLSAARAQMALYMLTRGGVSDKRIDRVEGYADHRLKSPANPLGAENRRIEILLRKDKA
jgi:chemotaxis protein MotB